MTEKIETCNKCGHKLIERAFDKCMYCGEPLPEKLRLSDEEKHKVLEEKQKRYQESQEKQERTRKKRAKQDKEGFEVDDFGFDDDGGSVD